MKNIELKGKGLDELNVLLGNFKKELFNLRFQKASGVLANTSRVSAVRKNIARVNTLVTFLKKGGEDA